MTICHSHCSGRHAPRPADQLTTRGGAAPADPHQRLTQGRPESRPPHRHDRAVSSHRLSRAAQRPLFCMSCHVARPPVFDDHVVLTPTQFTPGARAPPPRAIFRLSAASPAPVIPLQTGRCCAASSRCLPLVTPALRRIMAKSLSASASAGSLRLMTNPRRLPPRHPPPPHEHGQQQKVLAQMPCWPE